MSRFKQLPKQTNLASALVSIVIIVYMAYLLQGVIVPFIIAGLLSFLLYPLCQFLENIRIPRILAIVLCIVVMAAVVAGFLYVSYTQIVKLESLFPQIETKVLLWLDQAAAFLDKHFALDQFQLAQEAQKHVSEVVKSGSKFIGLTIGSMSNFLMSIGLMPLYIFLMLMYRDFLKTFLFKWLKDTSKHKIMGTVNKVQDVVQNYILGLLLVILIIGLLNSAALHFIGIEHAWFFGFFAAFLVILPYIGVAIGSALPIIVALITKDSYLAAVAVAGAFAVIQFLEGNFITPYVVGNQVSINSLIAITALLLFGQLWGIGGMILALPVTAIVKVIFDSSPRLEAWGFLLGDAAHADVSETRKKFKFKEFYENVKKKI